MLVLLLLIHSLPVDGINPFHKGGLSGLNIDQESLEVRHESLYMDNERLRGALASISKILVKEANGPWDGGASSLDFEKKLYSMQQDEFLKAFNEGKVSFDAAHAEDNMGCKKLIEMVMDFIKVVTVFLSYDADVLDIKFGVADPTSQKVAQGSGKTEIKNFFEKYAHLIYKVYTNNCHACWTAMIGEFVFPVGETRFKERKQSEASYTFLNEHQLDVWYYNTLVMKRDDKADPLKPNAPELTEQEQVQLDTFCPEHTALSILRLFAYPSNDFFATNELDQWIAFSNTWKVMESSHCRSNKVDGDHTKLIENPGWADFAAATWIIKKKMGRKVTEHSGVNTDQNNIIDAAKKIFDKAKSACAKCTKDFVEMGHREGITCSFVGSDGAPSCGCGESNGPFKEWVGTTSTTTERITTTTSTTTTTITQFVSEANSLFKGGK